MILRNELNNKKCNISVKKELYKKFIYNLCIFDYMMKEYNINIGPQNQKNAGLQNRTISTYNGLNRGL
jgi:hypothetical protein